MNEDEVIEDLLIGVDPKYHPAIKFALKELCNWYGDKAYRQVNDWFTAVYGAVLMVEEGFANERRQLKFASGGKVTINPDDFAAKPDKWIKKGYEDNGLF